MYFGADWNDVNEATPGYDPCGVYQGRFTDNRLMVTNLQRGRTYYWRVDLIDQCDNVYKKGWVSYFTVADYLVIDDFTDDANDELWARWIDGRYNGTGSRVFHSYQYPQGSCMRYPYDNDGDDYYSEVYRDFGPTGFDFTGDDPTLDIKALSLSLKGDANNSAVLPYDRMYIALESVDGNIAVVLHFDPSVQTQTSWDQWNIDLRDFNEGGVDLENIRYMYIGFGIRGNVTEPYGGNGTVYFDDIRLYPPRCVGEPGYRQVGDLTGDCVVNIEDLDLMTDAWLMQDLPWWVYVDPNDPNMLVRYQFEGNYNNDPNGRVGAAGNGTPMGTPSIVYDAVRDGNVLYTDQEGDVNDYVVCGTWGQDGNFAGKSFSIVFWGNQKELSTESGGWGDMVAKGESYQKVEFGSVPYLERNVHSVVHSSGVIVSSFKLDLNRWYHIASTYQQFPDMNGGIQRLYINGILDGENDMNEIPYGNSRHAVQWADPNWTIGAQEDEGNTVASPPVQISIQRPFHGYLDDVRVYDRLLSEQEMRWLWNPWYWPQCFEIPYPCSEANIYIDPCPLSNPCCQRIDLKDLTLLAQDWLEWDVWPPGGTP